MPNFFVTNIYRVTAQCEATSTWVQSTELLCLEKIQQYTQTLVTNTKTE